jgi:hypothetical protein
MRLARGRVVEDAVPGGESEGDRSEEGAERERAEEEERVGEEGQAAHRSGRLRAA